MRYLIFRRSGLRVRCRSRCRFGSTKDKLSALKQVLTRHPGTSDVHVRLISGTEISLWKVDDVLRVEPSSALMGDLKALLGPSCLTV
ncbi:hypothetical protein ACETU7_07110 [Rhodococcus sp. 3Y1]